MKTVEMLKENILYRYEFERLQGAWWHTLMVKRTGTAYILIDSNVKREAIRFFEGLDATGVYDAMMRCNVSPSKLYKPIEG